MPHRKSNILSIKSEQKNVWLILALFVKHSYKYLPQAMKEFWWNIKKNLTFNVLKSCSFNFSQLHSTFNTLREADQIQMLAVSLYLDIC